MELHNLSMDWHWNLIHQCDTGDILFYLLHVQIQNLILMQNACRMNNYEQFETEYIHNWKTEIIYPVTQYLRGGVGRSGGVVDTFWQLDVKSAGDNEAYFF